MYDLDGTLVNTREDIVRAANHMLEQMGENPLPADEICRYVGHGLNHLVQNCLRSGEIKKLEQGGKIFRRHYAEHMLDNSKLYPGTRELLEYFKDRKQAVITNKPDPYSTEMLKALDVRDFFFEIVAGNSEYPKKPDPEAAKALMAKAGASAEETLFIGDSPVDYETGRRGGFETALVLHGFTREDELKSLSPKLLFKDFKELLQYAEKERL